MFTIAFITASLLLLWVAVSYKQTIILREVPLNTKQARYARAYGGIPVDIKNKVPYLIRYTLLSCPLFTIKIHKALISDPDEPHDHPWSYLSIILKGGYSEQRTKVYTKMTYPNFGISDETQRMDIIKWHKPGSILFRRGNELHKLIIPDGKPCTSLIFTFPKWRKWGYLNKKSEWVQYTN